MKIICINPMLPSLKAKPTETGFLAHLIKEENMMKRENCYASVLQKHQTITLKRMENNGKRTEMTTSICILNRGSHGRLKNMKDHETNLQGGVGRETILELRGCLRVFV